MKLKKIILNNKYLYKIHRYLWEKKRYLEFKYNYEETVKKDFYKKLGYHLNLDKPKTFNEKIQWLKLNYRNPKMSVYADKYEVRDIIKQELGEKHLIKIYGIYDTVDEIDLKNLPNQFVLKPTHSSQRVIICTDKNKLNWKKEFKKMRKWLKHNYFYQGGEWVYRDLKPRIICEKLLDENIIDYKIYCFNGIPEFTQVVSNRDGKKYDVNYYDLNWKPTEIKRCDHKSNDKEFEKPTNYKTMIEFSKKISSQFPFVRMDFYEIKDKLYFGETTFFPANGLIRYSTKQEDEKWGELLKLPKRQGDKNDI